MLLKGAVNYCSTLENRVTLGRECVKCCLKSASFKYRPNSVNFLCNTFVHFSFRPESGEAANTSFKIACENWVTRDNPISYKFRYQVEITNLAEINTLSTESQSYQLWYFGERMTPSRVLPVGDPQNDFKLSLSARICNKYNCCTDFPLNAKVRRYTSCSSVRIGCCKGAASFPGTLFLPFELRREKEITLKRVHRRERVTFWLGVEHQERDKYLFRRWGVLG